MSTPDSISSGKGIEPGYQYTGPLEGQGETSLIPVVPEAGSPLIMKDEMVSMSLEPGQTKFTAPPVDNPNAPVPTKKALKLMATRRAIQEESLKGSGQAQTSAQTRVGGESKVGSSNATEGSSRGEKVGGSEESGKTLGAENVGGAGGPGGPNEGHVNLWLKYPNLLAALNMALLEIAATESQGRAMDSEILINLSTALFNAGMDNAEIAKMLKELAANKELIKAIGSFVQAAVSLYQMGSLVQARGETRSQIYNEDKTRGPISPETQSVLDQKAKVDQLKNPTKLASESDTDFQQRLTASQDKAAIKKEERELRRLMDARDTEFNQRSQMTTSVIDAKFRMLNAVSDGIFGVLSSFLTQQEGSLEKQRAINEAVMQFLNRRADAAAKAKDDQGASMDKILQLIVQQASDMRVHASTRG